MNIDNFTEAARAYAEQACYQDENRPIAEAGFRAGWKAARTYLAAQEPTDAAQIIDEHRTTGRWVGDGVRVECTCGHISPGSHPGGPQTAEDNAHRDADRKHAAHVADMLARAARRDEEAR